MGGFDSARPYASQGRPPRPWTRTPRRLAVAALLAACVGCFRPDYLDYAACETSESCRDAGLLACVILPDVPAQHGFCAAACEGDGDCPGGQDGDAAARCLPVAGQRVCALDCADGRTCPNGYVCRDTQDSDAATRALCFPLAEDPA